MLQFIDLQGGLINQIKTFRIREKGQKKESRTSHF